MLPSVSKAGRQKILSWWCSATEASAWSNPLYWGGVQISMKFVLLFLKIMLGVFCMRSCDKFTTCRMTSWLSRWMAVQLQGKSHTLL